MLEKVQWNCPYDNRQYRQILEKERIYTFLLGLNKDLDEVRERILSIKPLPNVREVFSEVQREETRRKVMLGAPNTTSNGESSTFATRSPQPSAGQQRRGNQP